MVFLCPRSAVLFIDMATKPKICFVGGEDHCKVMLKNFRRWTGSCEKSSCKGIVLKRWNLKYFSWWLEVSFAIAMSRYPSWTFLDGHSDTIHILGCQRYKHLWRGFKDNLVMTTKKMNALRIWLAIWKSSTKRTVKMCFPESDKTDQSLTQRN